MKRKTPVKRVKKSLYTATVNALGRKYSASGATIQDALGAIDAKTVRGKVIITVEKDGKSRERVLNPLVSSRLFGLNGMARQIVMKQVSATLEP